MLRTERLILSTWESSDWTAFRPIATDVEVMRYINGGVPWTDGQIQNFVDRQVRLYSARGFCRWRILEASTGEPIGSVVRACGAMRRTRNSAGGSRAAIGAGAWQPKPAAQPCRTPSSASA